MLFTDINRVLNPWGWYGPDRQGANHMKGQTPFGTTKAFVDGHVEWTLWKEMDKQLVGNGLEIYW